MVLLWWPLTGRDHRRDRTQAGLIRRSWAVMFFHAGPTMTCGRVSGEKFNGSCFCLCKTLNPRRRSESRTWGTLRRAGSNTEIRSGPAGDGGFTVNTVLEDNPRRFCVIPVFGSPCVHAWSRPSLGRDTETISLISLHGRPLFLAARLKDNPPIPLRAAVMRGSAHCERVAFA